ncbi:Phospholipid phosphatase 3 [Halotydeus destructor]|nr:Phospholipid phosphatase 3 [Halotydeus destructor]
MLTRKLKVEIALFLALSAFDPVLEKFAKPYRQGFWCDDHTIRYPLKPDTVSGLMLLFLTILLWPTMGFAFLAKDWTFWKTPFWKSYLKLNFPYYIGYVITACIGAVCKMFTGRLRPNFMDVCRPEPYFNSTLCPANQYISNYTCSTDLTDREVQDTHKSFPSGHASQMAYATIYLVIIWHRRLREDHLIVVRLSRQVAAICFCLWVALTRLMDNKHHWEDVSAGLFLGATVAMVTQQAFSLRNQDLTRAEIRSEKLSKTE